MARVISKDEAVKMVNDGDSIMFGGFLACGTPDTLIDTLVSSNVKDLHMIAICTDYATRGVGKLIKNKQVKSVQASHIGTNEATQEQYIKKEIEIELITPLKMNSILLGLDNVVIEEIENGKFLVKSESFQLI